MPVARPSPTPPTRARRPDPPPLRTNEYLPAVVGAALWTIAFVVLLVRHSAMASHGQGWWLWVSVVGIGIGVWGVAMVTLRQRSLRRGAAAAVPAAAAAPAATEAAPAATAATEAAPAAADEPAPPSAG